MRMRKKSEPNEGIDKVKERDLNPSSKKKIKTNSWGREKFHHDR